MSRQLAALSALALCIAVPQTIWATTYTRDEAVKIALEAKPEIFLHPGKQVEVLADGVVLGTMGELHPTAMAAFDIGYTTYVMELDMDKMEHGNQTR